MTATVPRLTRELRSMGVTAGSVIMVHAAMRRVGGRAEDLVTAMDAAVGRRGTWMMNIGPAPDPAGFDALDTVVDPDVGVLAEVFRTTPGTVVSNHPEGRMGARGRHAVALTADVPWHHYYGPGSPLARFLALDGSVLRLGADPETVTLYHYAEHLARVHPKVAVTRFPLVRAADGTTRRRRVDCLDDTNGIAPWPDEDYFAAITRAIMRSGLAQTGTVGGAVAERFDGNAAVAVAVRWIERHLRSSTGTAVTRPPVVAGEG